MRPIVRRLVVPAIAVAVTTVMSGCIVCPGAWCDVEPPREAALHVYASDYWTGAPVYWAEVDLLVAGWPDWDYVGTWLVDRGGYVPVYAGPLFRDGHGGPEGRTYRLEVFAGGYYREWFEIDLDYYYPAETVYFYLYPLHPGREVVPGDDGNEERMALPEGEGPPDRVRVGEPRDENPKHMN